MGACSGVTLTALHGISSATRGQQRLAPLRRRERSGNGVAREPEQLTLREAQPESDGVFAPDARRRCAHTCVSTP
jgi:hypothetical protein